MFARASLPPIDTNSRDASAGTCFICMASDCVVAPSTAHNVAFQPDGSMVRSRAITSGSRPTYAAFANIESPSRTTCSAIDRDGCRVDGITRDHRRDLLEQPCGHRSVFVEILRAEMRDVWVPELCRRASQGRVARHLELLGCVICEDVFYQLVSKDRGCRAFYRTNHRGQRGFDAGRRSVQKAETLAEALHVLLGFDDVLLQPTCRVRYTAAEVGGVILQYRDQPTLHRVGVVKPRDQLGGA